MELAKIEYRKKVISQCCSKKIYMSSVECSKCKKSCSFVIEKITTFQKWIINQSNKDKEQMIQLMRLEIVTSQNKKVFELMEMVDNGEFDFNTKTLERVADMLLKSNHITQ